MLTEIQKVAFYFSNIKNNMTTFESVICNMAEEKTSWEIEALISELQMIAERKYSEEENYQSSGLRYELFPSPLPALKKLSIFS